jgi:Holliday junction resolvasome RuvABC DNA-binding subunit
MQSAEQPQSPWVDEETFQGYTQEPPPSMAPDTLTVQEYAAAQPRTPAPQRIVVDKNTDNEIVVPDQGVAIAETSSVFALQSLPGVGDALARRMTEFGFTDFDSILTANVSGLTQIPGVSEIKAQSIVAYCQRALDTIAEMETSDAQEQKDDDEFSDA